MYIYIYIYIYTYELTNMYKAFELDFAEAPRPGLERRGRATKKALWNFYSTRVSSRKPAKTNKKSHSAVFVVFLLIICDNWSFMYSFNIKINQPSKTTCINIKFKYVIFTCY